MNNKASIRGFLAITSILGVLFVVYLLFYQPVPEGARDALNIALGILSSNLMAVSSFYFGSSESSHSGNGIQ